MTELKIGTAGWEYKDWVGPFYSKRLDRKEHLAYYATIFNINEINSSFYNLPQIETIKNWSIRVPENFRFLVKVWKNITHKIHENDLETKVSRFFTHFKVVEDKISGFLFQFPPWFQYSENNLNKLKHLVIISPKNYNYFIEFRHNSWYQTDKLSEIINGKNISLVTSYIEGNRPVYYPGQQFYYIRLIGDRSISTFNRVQRDQKEILDEMNNCVSELSKNPDIRKIFIIVNNHFTGFAPETANQLKKLWNIPIKSFSTQTSLTDFF